jgi:predicted permease
VNPKVDGYRTTVWVPSSIGDLALRNARGERVSALALEPSYKLGLVARMKPGVTPEQLAADASSIAAGFDPGVPPPVSSPGSRSALRHRTPSVAARDVFLNDPDKSLPASLAFTGVPTIVLLIACVNAALLLVARAASRGPEWTVRMAIGATRWRLARQLFIEATVLAAASGVAGVLAAGVLLRLQGRMVPLPLPIDGPVLVFTVATVVCVTLLFGVGPAWTTATRATMASRLGRHLARGRMRAMLVGAQAALCVGLLATGAQFLRALQVNMAATGVSSPANLIVGSFDLEPLHYTDSQADEFYTQLMRGISRAPGVERAGVSSSDYWGVSKEPDFARFFLPEDEADEPRTAGASVISGDLLETLELTLLKGRPPTPDKTGGVREIVVNDAFERMLPDGTALGRTLRIAPGQSNGEDVQAEVVGIVAPLTSDARSDSGTRPHFYYASGSSGPLARQLYVRTGNIEQSIAGLRQLVEELDDRVPIEVTTLEQFFATRRPEPRWIAGSTAGLGLLGLVLTAGGLLGVVSYVVTLRTPEIGVRVALGASQRNVLLLILRQALAPVAVGLVIGSAAAAALGLMTRARLYGSEPVDPVALAAGAALLLFTASFASFIPARRASRIQPNAVLKDTQ